MTALANDFIDKIRAHKIPNWGSWEDPDGALHVFRYEHPWMWTWRVGEPAPEMPGFMRITPVDMND